MNFREHYQIQIPYPLRFSMKAYRINMEKQGRTSIGNNTGNRDFLIYLKNYQ
jgi:hypothetical protein